MVRKARLADARDIHRLLLGYAKEGVMLPRSLAEIYESIREFFIYEESGSVLGVASLNICWDDLAEIRSLAVEKDSAGKGVGRFLVTACLDEARQLGTRRVFALTYEREFFKRLGFDDIEKSELPHKIWGACMRCAKFPDCDEDAVAIDLVID